MPQIKNHRIREMLNKKLAIETIRKNNINKKFGGKKKEINLNRDKPIYFGTDVIPTTKSIVGFITSELNEEQFLI